MIEELNCWNEKLIFAIFDREKAIQICSISLSRRGDEDKAIWGYTKDGKFTVRCAYHLGKSERKGIHGGCSCRQPQKYVWEKIWRLKIPGIAKQFLWKALNSILPTKTSLYQKKIVEDVTCPICCR